MVRHGICPIDPFPPSKVKMEQGKKSRIGLSGESLVCRVQKEVKESRRQRRGCPLSVMGDVAGAWLSTRWEEVRGET